MADDPKVIVKTKEEIAIQGIEWQKLTDNVTRTKQALDQLSSTEPNTEAWERAREKYLEAKKALDAFSDALSVSGLSAKQVTEKIKASTHAFGALAGKASKVGGIVGKALIGMKDNLSEFGELAVSAGNATLRNFYNPVTETGSMIKRVGGFIAGFNEALGQIIRTQNVARQTFVASNVSLKDNADIIEKYPQILRRMSVATGLSTKELNEMTKTMMIMGSDAITPTTRGLTQLGEEAKGGMVPAAALATTMRAFGMDAQQAAGFAVEGFKNFNQSAIATALQMGKVAQASKLTITAVNSQAVPLKVASEQILEASQGLAIFGQKSASAAGVWSKFTGTLRDSGVPIRQIGRLVTSLTQNIAGMSVQNRAFIGMMSGLYQGASALGGALKLEMAMRGPQGMEKNLSALTQSLSRFGGGKIITLEQATNNPQLEMQFQIQRQMLGQLAGINSNEDQNRVLETLQQVQKGGLSQVEGGKALKEVYSKGKDIQLKQLTMLERIEQQLRGQYGQGTDKKISAAEKAVKPVSEAGVEAWLATDVRKERGTAQNKTLLRNIGASIYKGFEAIKNTKSPSNLSEAPREIGKGINIAGNKIKTRPFLEATQPGDGNSIKATLGEAKEESFPQILSQLKKGVDNFKTSLDITKPSKPLNLSLEESVNKILEPILKSANVKQPLLKTTPWGDGFKKDTLMEHRLNDLRTIEGSRMEEIPKNTKKSPFAAPIEAKATTVNPGTSSDMTINISIAGAGPGDLEKHADSMLKNINNWAIGVRNA